MSVRTRSVGQDIARVFNVLGLTVSEVDISFDTDLDDDLVITIPGLTVRDDRIETKAITYEVEGAITLSVRFSVVAPDESEAQFAAESILSDVEDELSGWSTSVSHEHENPDDTTVSTSVDSYDVHSVEQA
jgi:hypothetical protein